MPIAFAFTRGYITTKHIYETRNKREEGIKEREKKEKKYEIIPLRISLYVQLIFVKYAKKLIYADIYIYIEIDILYKDRYIVR